MRTPPNRIAVVALALLVLAGAGAWWWIQSRSMPWSEGRPGLAGPALPESDDGEPTGGGQARLGRKVTAEQCGTAMMATLRTHAASLKQRHDAQSQLGYALAAPFSVFGEIAEAGERDIDAEAVKRRFEEQRAESQQAFARARALAPGNSDILWLAAIQCGAGTGTSVERTCKDIRKELLDAEPDNAAAWLREMAWARIRNDKAGVERAFLRAADAPRYDRHAGVSQLAILQAFSTVPMPLECAAKGVQAELQQLFPGEGKVGSADFVLMFANSLAGIETPAYMPIREHCGSAAGSELDLNRRAACGRVLEKMAGSDSMLDHAIALGLLVELAGDGDDAERWRERYREHQWLRSHMGKPVFQGLTIEDYAFDELGAMQHALEAHDMWPPPPDWLPTDERARSLILTGRPPESRR